MGTDDADQLVSRLLPERLHRLQRASGLPVVFGGPIRWTPAGPRLVIDRLIGTRGTSLRGLEVDPGRGLGGAVLRDARPGVVEDYAATGEITHDFDEIVVSEERLTSVMAVPVIVSGTVCGILYGAVRDPRPVGDRAVRSAAAVAAQLQRDVEAALNPVPVDESPRSSAQALNELAEIIRVTPDPAVRARLTRIHRELSGRAPRQRGPHPVESLSPRESEVLRHAGTGATNVEIAAELGLSPETVKAYLRTAMRKLGTPNRVAAARMLAEWNGL